ncbi:MAG: histidinol-phosphate transaminase [Venatoribacter sp.]
MTVNFLNNAVTGVQSLHPYQPGKPISELAREFGLNETDIVKLASNENPLGPSPKALQAIEKALAELTLYPDGAGFALKKALSDKFGLAQNQITLGNGSSDILDFIVRVFVNDGDNVVTSQHAFAVYGIVSSIVGAQCIAAPAKNYGHDLDAMLAAINERTKVVFVTNPNNPTGTWVNKQELTAFLDKVPAHILVLLDEAYFEFVQEPDYPNGLDLLPNYPNLVVARTFSKAYGLASLRVGYGVSSPEIADLFNRVRPPFNVNSLALVAAEAALKDDQYVQNSITTNTQGMRQLEQGFNDLGLSYIPSVANFVAFKMPAGVNAAEVFQKLLAQGVIVRPVAGYEMPEYLRVSVGTSAENSTFLAALKTALA